MREDDQSKNILEKLCDAAELRTTTKHGKLLTVRMREAGKMKIVGTASLSGYPGGSMYVPFR